MPAIAFHRPLLSLSLTICSGLLTQACHPCLGSDLEKGSPAELFTPVQLQKHLADPTWRILDARRSAQYDAGHIPGAVHVDAGQWRRRSGQPDGLEDAQFWTDAVAKLGIDRNMAAVVYADNVADMARVWWLLAYVGVPRVAMLDGGWQAWELADLPRQTEVPRVRMGDFHAEFATEWLVKTERPAWSRKSADVQIIDARSRDEYTGGRALGGAAGRIPAAIHLDWLDVLDSQGCFRKAGELRELLTSKGIAPKQRQVVYCYSGARSSVVVFALRRIGYHRVSNYYGGWQQWAAADLRTETGE